MAHVVVGLGNPGPEYRDTRHNVGQRVLDHLAAGDLRGTRWARDDATELSQGRWRGATVQLVKPLAFMNVCGPVIARVLRRHGGHNGVRSVIEALGTSDIRRVKVGIGRPEYKADVPDHVLTVFEPEEQETVHTAVAEAAQRVLALIQTGP